MTEYRKGAVVDMGRQTGTVLQVRSYRHDVDPWLMEVGQYVTVGLADGRLTRIQTIQVMNRPDVPATKRPNKKAEISVAMIAKQINDHMAAGATWWARDLLSHFLKEFTQPDFYQMLSPHAREVCLALIRRVAESQK